MFSFRIMNMAVIWSFIFRDTHLNSWSCLLLCLLFRKRCIEFALSFSVSMNTMALPMGISFRSASMIGAILCFCVFIFDISHKFVSAYFYVFLPCCRIAHY